MAGNMCEWTTGHNINNDNMFTVPRGGSFYWFPSQGPVVVAFGWDDFSYFSFDVSFRVVLYIQ